MDCFVAYAPRNDGRNCPTGKSLLIFRNRVKPKNQKESKILRFRRRANQRHRLAYPVPLRGASAIVTNVGTGCGGRGCAPDERRGNVRRRRVVLTPRCWCQVGGKFPAGDGDKKADHRGERDISRKAIAQGMSDALRCPVCSCAHFLCNCTRDRGCSAHPAFPAPSDWRV